MSARRVGQEVRREPWSWVVLATLVVVGCSQGPGSTSSERVVSVEPGAWQPLFNGRDLTGWLKHRWRDKPVWTFRDGVLRSEGGKGYLRTERTFKDFELVLEARVWDTAGGRGNSGVCFRCQRHIDQSKEYPPRYEVQIDHHDRRNPTGSIYNRHPARPTDIEDGEWFELRLRAVGPRMQVWVNGKLVVDARDTTYDQGYLFLQQHHRTGVCEFRHIRIRELSSEPGSRMADRAAPSSPR